MKLMKKHFKKIIQSIVIVGVIVTVCTGCGNHQSDTKAISIETSQKGIQQGEVQQLSDVEMTINEKQSREVKGKNIKQVTPKQLYTAFKETIEKVASDTSDKKQIPSAVARDFDGDGLAELLIITGESEGYGLLIQMYEYELETDTCYLSDEMKRGIGSSVDGAASYSLYEDDQGSYLISIFNGRDFGEAETMINYEDGKFEIYSYKNHSVAIQWVEKEKKDTYHHTYTYELGEKEVSEKDYEKAVQNYKQVMEIATTDYAKDTINDKTNGAEEMIKRYRELTNDDEAALVIKETNFIEDGKLSISSNTMNEFMSMNLDELSQVFGDYTKSEYAEYIYIFPNYDFSIYSEVNGEVMAATFYGSTKIMGISFLEHTQNIAEQLGRPEEDYYNEQDDRKDWIYTKGGYRYTLGFNPSDDSLENIMVQSKN